MPHAHYEFGIMVIKKMKSEFLTDIAKEFNNKIDQVRFEQLERGHLGRVIGAGNLDGYCILIDRAKLHCSFHIFFTLFHEIAHIELSHTGIRFYLADEHLREIREKEANEWAFKQLEADANKVCLRCLQSIPEHCLRGWPLSAKSAG
jgi:hypothetical protein